MVCFVTPGPVVAVVTTRRTAAEPGEGHAKVEEVRLRASLGTRRRDVKACLGQDVTACQDVTARM